MKKIFLLILGVMYAPGTESVDGRTSMSAGSMNVAGNVSQAELAMKELVKAQMKELLQQHTNEMQGMRAQYEVLSAKQEKTEKEYEALLAKQEKTEELLAEKSLILDQQKQELSSLHARTSLVEKREQAVAVREKAIQEQLDELKTRMDVMEGKEREISIRLTNLKVNRVGVEALKKNVLESGVVVKGYVDSAQKQLINLTKTLQDVPNTAVKEQITQLEKTLQDVQTAIEQNKALILAYEYNETDMTTLD